MIHQNLMGRMTLEYEIILLLCTGRQLLNGRLPDLNGGGFQICCCLLLVFAGMGVEDCCLLLPA
jgi:hypothetical protein